MPDLDESGRPVIGPDDIPKHVVDAFRVAYTTGPDGAGAIEHGIAAALAVLMDDEEVEVAVLDWERGGWVHPSDVLAAVLERRAARP